MENPGQALVNERLNLQYRSKLMKIWEYTVVNEKLRIDGMKLIGIGLRIDRMK
jgi:hypothetical protein